MARLVMYGNRDDGYLTPCYGGPPIKFRLAGFGWWRFFLWMARYQIIWHDRRITVVDGDTGRVVKESNR